MTYVCAADVLEWLGEMGVSFKKINEKLNEIRAIKSDILDMIPECSTTRDELMLSAFMQIFLLTRQEEKEIKEGD